MVRPNFDNAFITGSGNPDDDGQIVRVLGTSDGETSDILDILVVLVQGKRIARGSVDKVTSGWFVEFPVNDPNGEQPAFVEGDALAFGTESRIEHNTTITWIQNIVIG
jgi:hypothetical protein